eukprot:scaffold70717_cov42-Cyclotella_meneghiniana.AAC.1
MGVPFECDLCHFRNMRKRNPDFSSHRDVYLLMMVRRANLDACWARASSTVAGNLSRAAKDNLEARVRTGLDGAETLPVLGWPKLEDRVGMAGAVQTLSASLREGKYAGHLQPESVRRTRSWWNNAYNAGAGYLTDSIFTSGEKKVVETTSPLSGEWYTRFIRGVRLRTGEIRKQDLPFTSKIVLALDKICEIKWRWAGGNAERQDIEDLMCFVLMEFCGDLRGEEVTLLSLGGLLTFWEDSLNSDPQYIMLTLHGRFKGETGLRWHCIPLPVKTKSALPNFKWIARAVHRRVNLQGRHKGWFFADGEGKKRKMSYYKPMLQDHLLSVQENMKEVIPTSVDVEGFSLWRSGRSGAHTEATNNQVPEHVIRTMGR